MSDRAGTGSEQRRNSDAAERKFQEETLSRIATTFGRLVYLAALQDPTSGRYHEPGLVKSCGLEEADRLLRQNHEHVFGEWLKLPLQQQHRELQQHLETIRENNDSDAAAWRTLERYKTLAPAAAQPAEMELYRSDLEVLLEILRQD